MQGAYTLVCPSGSIDLLIGSKESSVAEADLQIKLLKFNDIIIRGSSSASNLFSNHIIAEIARCVEF